jgi:hypothetical protein
MTCLIISPKAGVLRATQFTNAQVNTLTKSARPGDARSDSSKDSSELSGLDRRCHAPFRLSKALQARLLGAPL